MWWWTQYLFVHKYWCDQTSTYQRSTHYTKPSYMQQQNIWDIPKNFENVFRWCVYIHTTMSIHHFIFCRFSHVDIIIFVRVYVCVLKDTFTLLCVCVVYIIVRLCPKNPKHTEISLNREIHTGVCLFYMYILFKY